MPVRSFFAFPDVELVDRFEYEPAHPGLGQSVTFQTSLRIFTISFYDLQRDLFSDALVQDELNKAMDVRKNP